MRMGPAMVALHQLGIVRSGTLYFFMQMDHPSAIPTRPHPPNTPVVGPPPGLPQGEVSPWRTVEPDVASSSAPADRNTHRGGSTYICCRAVVRVCNSKYGVLNVLYIYMFMYTYVDACRKHSIPAMDRCLSTHILTFIYTHIHIYVYVY